MSFSFNGNTPRKIIFNNQDVKKLIYNNDVVWEKKRLPVEYQEVEYIESTGTQYIDTGIASTRYITASLDMQFTEYSSSSMIIIAWSTGAGRWFGKGGLNTYSGGNDAVSDVDALLRKEIEVFFTPSTTSFTIDGVTYSKAVTSSKSNGYTLFAGRNVSSGVAYYASAKLYKATIQENGETIKDFIPCYRKIDKKPGLYDAFNDVFYTNDGTGEFNVGADIITLPADYQRVEYIESTGTQYIDTNYTPNQNTKAYTKFNSNTLQSGLYSSSNKFTAYINSNGNWRFGSTTVRITTSIGVLYTSVQDKTGVIINETDVYNYNNTVTDFTSTATLRLMFNSTGFKGKIYEFKLYDNDILVRNFIPCYRKSDNVAGMYDIVTGKFFTNDGTGSFAVGNNI